MRSWKTIFALTVWLALLSPLMAESPSAYLLREAQEQLAGRQAAYAAWREQLAAERIPLQESLTAERERLARLRGERAEQARERTALEELRTAQARLAGARREALATGQSLLEDYRERAALHWPLPEWTAENLVRTLGGHDPEQSETALWAEVLSAARLRLEQKAQGGVIFPGAAVAPDGRLVEGWWQGHGPLFFFRSGERDLFGVGDSRTGGRWPGLAMVEGSDGVIAAWWQGDRPTVWIDASGGRAWSETPPVGIFARMRQGGPVMIPIALLGLGALLIALGKGWQLRGYAEMGEADLTAFLDHCAAGQSGSARGMAASRSGPVRELWEVVAREETRDRALLEELLFERFLRLRPGVERFLPFLALTAATAPLLGLLGTVTGMITTFNQITLFGTGEPRILSGGISEALLTTQFGLMVAVPALLAHAFLQRRAKAVLAGVEEMGARLVNGLAVRGRLNPETREEDDD